MGHLELIEWSNVNDKTLAHLERGHKVCVVEEGGGMKQNNIFEGGVKHTYQKPLLKEMFKNRCIVPDASLMSRSWLGLKVYIYSLGLLTLKTAF